MASGLSPSMDELDVIVATYKTQCGRTVLLRRDDWKNYTFTLVHWPYLLFRDMEMSSNLSLDTPPEHLSKMLGGMKSTGTLAVARSLHSSQPIECFVCSAAQCLHRDSTAAAIGHGIIWHQLSLPTTATFADIHLKHSHSLLA